MLKPELDYWILEGKTPVRVRLLTWAKWMQEDHSKKILKKTIILCGQVSTIFLGIDHSFLPDSEPILFESMVFGGVHDGKICRYSTWDEAMFGHDKLVSESLMDNSPDN